MLPSSPMHMHHQHQHQRIKAAASPTRAHRPHHPRSPPHHLHHHRHRAPCLLSSISGCLCILLITLALHRFYNTQIVFSYRQSLVVSGTLPLSPSPHGEDEDTGSLYPLRTVEITNWCDEKDKKATAGWASLSDEECMRRVGANMKKLRDNGAMVVFKHVHKSGGTTLCQIAQRNALVVAEDVSLPFRSDWTTNCVPYESFLGPHPAVELTYSIQKRLFHRKLQGVWLGGACFFGFLTISQLAVLPAHYRPLTFVASEGPMPDAIPLDSPFLMIIMLRNPLDRVLSSYKWWRFMTKAMPHSPTECRAYWAPENATFQEWIHRYPSNWVTRELAGREALYRKDDKGRPAPLQPADVERAKRRLHYFAAILILERIKGSEMLLKRVLRWENVDFEAQRAGSSQNSSAHQELSLQPEMLMKLRELNKYDIEIYEYALVLHEKQVAMMMSSFPDENKQTTIKDVDLSPSPPKMK